MPIALVRPVSPSLSRCALTFREREPIDVGRAERQHRDYRRALERVGCTVVELPGEPELPDAVFVEDTAVVVDEVAVLARPALASRRAELPAVEVALRRYRPLVRIEQPATLEGGDVLRIGRRVFVGRSSRTNEGGIAQLASVLGRHGYEVVSVAVQACLHLKSACSYLGRDTVLVQPGWVDPAVFAGLALLEVSPEEPAAGNALLVGETVIHPVAFPRTRALLEEAGFAVTPVEASELAKAEGGVTCTSVLLEVPRS